MTFGNNIMFSAVVHVTMITAALALAGRDAVSRVPEGYVVTLIGQAATPQQEAGKREEESARESVQSVRRGRLQPPAVAPSPVPERKETTPVPLPEEKSLVRDAAGPAKGDQPEVRGSIQGDQGGESRRTSSGTMYVSLPGNEAGKGGPTAGKEKDVGRGPWAIGAIRDAIERAKTYPALARKRNQEGTVVAEFSINAKGLPENVRVTKSSGFSLLDSAARDTIVRAAPFPVVSGRIEVAINFVLK